MMVTAFCHQVTTVKNGQGFFTQINHKCCCCYSNITSVRCQQRLVTIMLGLLVLSKLVHYMFNVTNVRCQQRMVTIMLGLLVLPKLVHYMLHVTNVRCQQRMVTIILALLVLSK